MARSTKTQSVRKTAKREPKTSEAASAAGELPSPEDIARALTSIESFAVSPDYGRVRGFLHQLAERPPQVLLLEGGTPVVRRAAAHYWALLCNCEHCLPPFTPDTRPCLSCRSCISMAMHMHRDCFFLDGSEGSIKIDDIRQVREVLGEPPREARTRMVVLAEAQALVEAAANALLKSLEEPCPGTLFILVAPQRERLLPTIVSRSLVLTLPWPATGASGAGAASGPAMPLGQTMPDEDGHDGLIRLEAALCLFLESAQGWFPHTGGKGAVTNSLAERFVTHCRLALVQRLLSEQSGEHLAPGLAAVLTALPPARLRMVDEVLAECQESLQYNVNPALVLDWLATRLYLLLPRPRGTRPPRG